MYNVTVLAALSQYYSSVQACAHTCESYVICLFSVLHWTSVHIAVHTFVYCFYVCPVRHMFYLRTANWYRRASCSIRAAIIDQQLRCLT
jgi:hypothetical protein